MPYINKRENKQKIIDTYLKIMLEVTLKKLSSKQFKNLTCLLNIIKK